MDTRVVAGEVETTRPVALAAQAAGVESVDTSMTAMMRLILATSALVIIFIDPTEPSRLVGLTYTSLALYVVYSVVLTWLSVRRSPLPAMRLAHWADVCFYVYLVSLTEGTSSIFFYFFLFAILVASFSWGFREGIRVTLASTALFVVAGLVAAPVGPDFELNRTLIRPIYLLVLGYMIAYWGGAERLLKRRLSLLKDVHAFANPRFGVEQTVRANLQRLIDFYSADSCILVLAQGGDTFTMYRAVAGRPHGTFAAERIDGETARPFLGFPATVAAAANTDAGAWWESRRPAYVGLDLPAGTPTGRGQEQCADLASLLDARAFVTVPYLQQDATAGRLYLASSEGGFERRDIEFLCQVVESIAPGIQSLQLLDLLVSGAAERERARISRDIHDTTIQPYVGLKLGLEALHRRIGPQAPLAREIGELIEMADATIQELRGYVARLKGPEDARGDDLVSAVRRHAATFRQYYGIEVDVTDDVGERINDRLGAEAFQIVCEGLSNVFRHTEAKRASVRVQSDQRNLRLEIGNESPHGASLPLFTPRSVAERAAALGGSISVSAAANGFTMICVNIPL